MANISLSNMPTVTQLYDSSKLSPAEATRPGATSKFNSKISLIRTDITKLETDAIVNAANESLLGGGGVDGAIHRAAGPILYHECYTLDGCDTGNAKITNAYRLPCNKVIHAVGPVYYTTKRKGMHTTLLQSCYTRSLDLAAENDCKSIAFSALSTGVYGYPSEEAAETAIEAVKGWLEADESRAEKMERIVFCQFMEKDQRAYEKFVPEFFPPEAAAENETGDDAKAGETTAEAETADGSTSAEEDPANVQKDDSTIPETESAKVEVPDLPEVPNQEPGEQDLPEAKKIKLDENVKE